MGRDSSIEWCDATFNPWIGCEECAPGCAGCYARTSTPVRAGMGGWGKDGERHVTGGDYWSQPLRWNRDSDPGRPTIVFGGSLCDPMEDRRDLDAPRRQYADLILATPNLRWVLLTKRPQNWRLLHEAFEHAAKMRMQSFPPQMGLCVSVATQRDANMNLPLLKDIPVAMRGVSAEPLVEKVLLEPWQPWLNWVKIGGESDTNDHKARPFDLHWAYVLMTECVVARTPAFIKQMGSRPVWNGNEISTPFRDKKGADWNEWPEGLDVRQYPRWARRRPMMRAAVR